MHLIQPTEDPKVYEVNWMWFPHWLTLSLRGDAELQRLLSDALSELSFDQADDDMFARADQLIVSVRAKRFPALLNLEKLLLAVNHVSFEE